MAHRRRDLSCLEELRGELRVDGIRGEVENGAVSADVEHGVVVVCVHVREFLRARQLGFYSLVVQELDAFFVFECLRGWEMVGTRK